MFTDEIQREVNGIECKVNSLYEGKINNINKVSFENKKNKINFTWLKVNNVGSM